MREGKLGVLLEELYRLMETVAEGVSENSRRLELLTAEIAKLKESQTRTELYLRRLEGELKGRVGTALPTSSIS